MKLHISINVIETENAFQKFSKKNFQKKIEVDAPTNLHLPPTPPRRRVLIHRAGTPGTPAHENERAQQYRRAFLCRLNERLHKIKNLRRPKNTMQHTEHSHLPSVQIHLYILYILRNARAQNKKGVTFPLCFSFYLSNCKQTFNNCHLRQHFLNKS